MQKKNYISFLSFLFALFLSMDAASFAYGAGAPAISNVNTTATSYSVTFTWNTSIPADSWVDFDVNGSRYVPQGTGFALRNSSTYVFSEFRDSSTGQMVGRCDGGGEVTNHCVKLLAPAPAKAYPFRIKSCSGGTNCSLSDVSSFTSAFDTIPPTWPTSLNTGSLQKAEVDHIDLNWVASYDNAPRYYPGYRIYRDNRLIKTIDPVRYIPPTTINLTQSFTPLIDSSANRDININVPIDINLLGPQVYTDFDVLPDTTYTYYVTAIDLGGNESLPSIAIQRHTPAVCPPGSIEAESSETPSPETSTTPLPALVCVPISPLPSPPPGQGVPIISNVKAVPAAPYTVTFTWNTSIPADSLIDIIGEGFEYTDPSTGQVIGRCDGGGQVTSHCIKLLTPVPGKVYSFQVKSCSSIIRCSFSSTFSFTSALDTTRPTVPADLRTNVTGTGDVELTWNPARDDAPRYYPGYKIYRNGALLKIIDPLRYTPAPKYRDLNVNVPIELSSARVRYVDFDVLPNTTYTYYITSLDLGGNESLPSNIVRVSSAPVTGTLTISNITAAPAAPYTVTFRWNTSIPADSWVDIDQSGIRYVLRGSTYELIDSLHYTFPDSLDPSTGQMIGRCDGGGEVTSHCVKLVTPVPGKVYPFRIKSCTSGTTCELSDISSFTSALDTTRPTVPVNLRTNVTGASGVQLTWGPSRDDAPRYYPGYKVYKNGALIKTIDPVRYTPLDQDLNVNATIALNNTNVQYVDTNVSLDVVSTYYVTAIDLGGNESLSSDSNSIQCTQTSTLVCIQILSRLLQFGSRGEDVKVLQQLLIRENVYPEAIVSGYFGSLTRNAVTRFQQKYDIFILDNNGVKIFTGIVDTPTRSKMNEILLTNAG